MNNKLQKKCNVDDFIKFESEHGLFEYEIDNIKIWPLIRVSIYNKLLQENNNLGNAHYSFSGKSFSYRLLKRLKNIPEIILKSPFFITKQKDILVLNHPRRTKNGNYFDCLYTEDIFESDNDCIVIEDPYIDSHIKPIRTKNIYYSDLIWFLVIVKNKFRGKMRLTGNHKVVSEQIYLKIKNEFDTKLTNDDVLSILSKKIGFYKELYKYYTKLVDRISPKVIIEVVSYDLSRMVINSIARKKGIPTIELQHGTMGKYHIAYSYHEKRDLHTFPEYVFVYGEFWKLNTRFPIEDDNVIVVGWPYYERKVKENTRKMASNKEGRKTILFISQGVIGEQFSKIAVEVSNRMKSNNYKFIYKLHPGEYLCWRIEYPWLIDSEMEVIDKYDEDMHHYFSLADIQIGVSSTSLFEGIGYNIKTIVYKLPTHNYMEDLYKNDLVLSADNIEQLIKYIIQDDETKKIDVNYFWQDDSYNLMNENIKAIISKKETF